MDKEEKCSARKVHGLDFFILFGMSRGVAITLSYILVGYAPLECIFRAGEPRGALESSIWHHKAFVCLVIPNIVYITVPTSKRYLKISIPPLMVGSGVHIHVLHPLGTLLLMS